MFYDLIKNRRSIRKFQNKEVEQEKIDIILKSALMSPSSEAGNHGSSSLLRIGYP